MAEENVQTTEQTTPATDIQQDQDVDTTQATTATTAEQTDIEKLDAKIADLEADGAELFADAIQILKDKRAALVAKAEADAKEAEIEVTTAAKTFKEKYGNLIVNGIEIVGIGAIVYRLFFF
jgi:molecular chaperone GrpE (heat shock protein)